MDYKELKYFFKSVLPKIAYEPNKNNIFKVFETHPKDIKLVIVGKSPYPNYKMATGLAFQNNWESLDEKVGNNLKSDLTPQELIILEKELKNNFPDYQGINTWQKQGVFLLNSSLTSERGNDESHLSYWKQFTNQIIRHISSQEGQNIVWLLWGGAKSFIPQIANKFDVNPYNLENIKNIPIYKGKNYILHSESPMSEYWGNGGFYNKNHFLITNKILEKSRLSKVNF
jgi:uracil-DNA glycosylase